MAGAISGAVGFVAAVLAVWLNREAARNAAESRARATTLLDHMRRGDTVEPGPSDNRIDRLVESLHESQRLISALQAEIDAKAAAVARLRAEEEQSRHLAAVRAEEAAAVRKLISSVASAAHQEVQEDLGRLQDELASMQRSSRRDQWRFFGAGVLASIPIGVVINILF